MKKIVSILLILSIAFSLQFPLAVSSEGNSGYIVSGMSIAKALTEDKYGNAYDKTYPMTNIIDGDSSTLGANAYYYATAGTASKTMTVIDLGAEYELKAVEITPAVTSQLTEAFNAVSPVSTYKKPNANGAGIYVSNSIPAYTDFNGYDVSATSKATDLVRLKNGGNSLSNGDWDPEKRGTSICNTLEDGKKYRYLAIWSPNSGGHALNEIKIKVTDISTEITSFTADETGYVSLSVINAPDTATAYIGSYDENDRLLEVHNIVLSYGMAMKTFKTANVYKYKAFVWDNLYAPVTEYKSIIPTPIYDIDNLEYYQGENGNWWVCDFDTGIEANSQNTVMFQINPMTYHLEVSYDNGTIWERLNCIADNSDITEYDYPIEKREILSGTITTDKNIFIDSSDYRGSLINVEDSVFDTVTITKGENKLGYAFLAAKPEAYVLSPKFPEGYSPSYAAGYTRVKYSDEQEITVKIPDNARYLYIDNNSSDKSFVPSAIKFIKSDNNVVNHNSIRLATWNIGHYSIGQHSNTDISNSAFATKSAEYEDYIYNVLNADVIALNEYSKKFTGSKNAKDTIFRKYDIAYEGTQYNYSCNALYSRADVTNIQAQEFECNKTADIESPNAIYASDYYYVTADLNLNGETIKLVSAHLAFYAGKSSTPPPISQNQIKELIQVYKDYDRVIFMGDWNCSYDNFQLFTDAGYSLANTDKTLSTYSASQRPLDNIIYKGVTVSDFGLAGTKLSNHYAIYCTITVD